MSITCGGGAGRDGDQGLVVVLDFAGVSGIAIALNETVDGGKPVGNVFSWKQYRLIVRRIRPSNLGGNLVRKT